MPTETTDHDDNGINEDQICAMVERQAPRVCRRCGASPKNYCRDVLAQVTQRAEIEKEINDAVT